jgi:CheY-like chemotaxis protein/nitrite reductase/ring-hydroxylating ferredoxin subunit
MPDFNTVPAMLRTVLIADEDAAFRKYLAMPLAAQGFTIYEAADGSAAWQLAVQNRPWMILADVSMPEVDGFEFCRRVRTHPLLARLPLLFISGSDKYKERYRALQIGADDFLTKSTPIRELLMRIQLLMTRYSDLSASGEPQAGAAEVAGAFQGRIEVFGAPALLQMCAQGRLTGLVLSEEPGIYNYIRRGEIIRCPWHAWEFDIRTGKSWCDPNRVRARNYAVSVEKGDKLVEGPYVAETFPVRVEDDYVVVEA